MITEKELDELLSSPDADLERITTISNDGSNLLTRIPRPIVRFLELKKGDKIKWHVDVENKELKIKVKKSGN